MKKLLLLIFICGIVLQTKLTAQFGDALLFDGTTGYVMANSVSVAVGNASNMTMEAWCYPTANSNWRSIVAFNTTSGASSNRNMIEYDGSIQKFAYFDQLAYTIFSPSVSTVNAWYHVAVVISAGDLNNGTLYVNGVIENTFTTATRPDNTASGQFSIGQEWDNPSPSEFFSGYIDEVRIWNVARSQVEIQSTMNTTLAGNEAGLVAYYQMTDGSGITLTDNSGNGNAGTLVGGVNFASPATPLPVELTSFSANINGSNVFLRWQTATELNSYGFEVEKAVGSPQSTVGSKLLFNWIKIGFIQGSGNSNSPKEYSFIEANPASGKSYFRLKMIDIDGSVEYSDIVEVSFNLDISTFELSQNYPNPFNPTTNIRYSIGSRQNVSLRVFDVLGEEIATLVNETKEAGNYTIGFNAANLPSGVYFYKLQAGAMTKLKKMIFNK